MLRAARVLRYLPLHGVTGKPFHGKLSLLMAQVASTHNFTSPYWITSRYLDWITSGQVVVQNTEKSFVTTPETTMWHQNTEMTGLNSHVGEAETEKKKKVISWYNIAQTTDPSTVIRYVKQYASRYHRGVYHPLEGTSGALFHPAATLHLQIVAALNNYRSPYWISEVDLPKIDQGTLTSLPESKGLWFERSPLYSSGLNLVEEPDSSKESENSDCIGFTYFNAEQTTKPEAIVSHYENCVARSALTGKPYSREIQPFLQTFAKEHQLRYPYWFTKQGMSKLCGETTNFREDAQGLELDFSFQTRNTYTSTLYPIEHSTNVDLVLRRVRLGLALDLQTGLHLPLRYQANLFAVGERENFKSRIWFTKETLKQMFADRVSVRAEQKGIYLATGENEGNDQFEKTFDASVLAEERKIPPLHQPSEETMVWYNSDQTTNTKLVEYTANRRTIFTSKTNQKTRLMRSAFRGTTYPREFQEILRGVKVQKGFRSNYWLTERQMSWFQPKLEIREGESPVCVEGYLNDLKTFLYNVNQLKNIEVVVEHIKNMQAQQSTDVEVNKTEN